jgi:hypothetical protein
MRHTHYFFEIREGGLPIYRAAERNCLVNPNGLYFRVPGVGKTRGEAPLLCGFAPPKTRDPDPSSYFPNSFSRKVGE